MAEQKEDEEQLVRSLGNSEVSEELKEKSQCLTFKLKLIIIISASVLIAGATITTILLLLLKDKSNNDNNNKYEQDLTPIIINPVSNYTHCIIWLHGLYATPEKFENLFKTEVPFAKKNNTKIILMRAPHQIMTFSKENATSWFDLFTFPINNTECYNFTDVIKSRKMVEKYIEQEAKELNGNYKNIFLGGHSQGACITLHTAYNYKELLGGVLACSGILFPQGEIVGDKNKLKIFLAHGDKDESIPFDFHLETVKRIENFEGVKKYYYKDLKHHFYEFKNIYMGNFLDEAMI